LSIRSAPSKTISILTRTASIRCNFPFSASNLICKDVGTHFMFIFFFFSSNDIDFTNAVADRPLPYPIVWLFFTSLTASLDNALTASSYVNYSTSA